VNSGYCTNLPSACANAAKKEPIPMSGPDTRCPECGSGLIAAKDDTAGSNKQKLIIGAVLLAVVIVIVAAFQMMRPSLPTSSPAASSIPSESIGLRLSGSNTIGAVLAPQLVKAWLTSKGATDVTIAQRKEGGKNIPETVVNGKLNGKVVNVEIRAHGSATAFKHLGDGSADIGMSSRQINSAEKTALAALGDMNSRSNEHVIGLDGVAVIVAPGNRLSSVAREDLARIFAGSASDWSQVGAGSGPIHVFARDDNSGTYDTFRHLVLGNLALVTNAQRLEDSTELEAAVGRDPAAIGFVGLPYVKTARAVPVSDSKMTQPLSPTVFTVKKEDYPLSRRLFFYTAANPANQNVGDFVRFTQSEAGQQVVKAVGFVDQNLNIADARPRQSADRSCTLSNQWPGPKDAYCKLVTGKADLGTNFRFRTGSSELDNRAAQDLQRVLKLMTEQAGRRLTLIGFADSQGKYPSNRTLSDNRANAVKSALQTLGISNVDVFGFGQEIPVSDNSTADGRDRNRRVEIWVN